MKVHHTAVVVRDLDASLRFWCDGLGFEVKMDTSFEGDWPTLFGAPGTGLRSIFLGDPADDTGGILELVDFGPSVDDLPTVDGPAVGFFLVSVNTDVDAALARLADLGLGGEPKRIAAYGVTMVVVTEPSGMRVELIDLP